MTSDDYHLLDDETLLGALDALRLCIECNDRRRSLDLLDTLRWRLEADHAMCEKTAENAPCHH